MQVLATVAARPAGWVNVRAEGVQRPDSDASEAIGGDSAQIGTIIAMHRLRNFIVHLLTAGTGEKTPRPEPLFLLLTA
jgi:hypothetical protein